MVHKEAQSVTENNIIMIYIIIHVNKLNKVTKTDDSIEILKYEENRKVCFSVET